MKLDVSVDTISVYNLHIVRCLRSNTHVISAILNLGQDVSEDWPLFVRDHGGQDHAVSSLISWTH